MTLDEWLEGPFRTLIAPHMGTYAGVHIRDRYEMWCCPLSFPFYQTCDWMAASVGSGLSWENRRKIASAADSDGYMSIRARMLAIMAEEAGR